MIPEVDIILILNIYGLEYFFSRYFFNNYGGLKYLCSAEFIMEYSLWNEN